MPRDGEDVNDISGMEPDGPGGTGLPADAELAFDFWYASGSDPTDEELEEMFEADLRCRLAEQRIAADFDCSMRQAEMIGAMFRDAFAVDGKGT